MNRINTVVVAVSIISLATLACLSASPSGSAGGGSVPTLADLPHGDASAGKALFNGSGGAPACSICHSLNGEAGVGPSLRGISSRAGITKSNLSAEAYLYESITSPDAYVVDGFHSSIMPSEFGSLFSPQELADLLAFLMTQ